MADQGTTQEPVEGAEGAAGGTDAQIGTLIEGFNTFRGEITQRLDGLEADLFEPEEGGEPEFQFAPNDFPAAPVQTGAAGAPTIPVGPEGGAPAQPEVPQEAAAILDKFIGERLTQGLQAFEQRLTQANTARERQQMLDAHADQLETKYPELQDEATAMRLVDATAALAAELGQPSLAGDSRLLERVLLAERAQAGAASAGQQQEVHLESGGAAAPSAPQGEVDAATGIVAAAQKKRLF